MEEKKEVKETKDTPITSDENSQDSEISSRNDKEEASENYNNKNLEIDTLEEQEREKLKGDAIGDTLYSERFVLKTLMELKEMDTEQKLDPSMVSLYFISKIPH